jgi:hypothetical protein
MRSPLTAFALFVLAVQVVLTIVGVAAEWPTQFGDPGDPEDVETEWIARGTAVSAPLGPMVVLLVGALLAQRLDRWALVGIALTAIVAVVMLIGALGEAFADSTSDVPRGVLVGSGVLSGTLAVVLLVLCWRALATHRSRRVA